MLVKFGIELTSFFFFGGNKGVCLGEKLYLFSHQRQFPKQILESPGLLYHIQQLSISDTFQYSFCRG